MIPLLMLNVFRAYRLAAALAVGGVQANGCVGGVLSAQEEGNRVRDGKKRRESVRRDRVGYDLHVGP